MIFKSGCGASFSVECAQRLLDLVRALDRSLESFWMLSGTAT
jgi:hypothetical protein